MWSMSLFGWMLVFGFLALASAAFLVLMGLRLWRGAKALGRDVETASRQFAGIGSIGDRTAPH
jgi:threonine/homoserine/homoserine lactone efflux protein